MQEQKPNKRNRVLFLGPLPPPYMGPTLATEILLKSGLADNFELIHMDTSDHRPLDTLGAIDFTNIYLALKSYVELIWMIIRYRPKLVYIPVSQATIGYLKDSGYILLSKMFGRKVMCHLRGGNFRNWYDSASRLTRAYVRFAHGLVNGQIVLGQSLRGLFSGLVPEKNIYVVPNGRDFSYEVQQRADNGVVRVLYIGNLVLSKGVYDVIRSVPRVVSETGNVEFNFAGAWVEPDVKEKVDRFMSDNPGLPVQFKGVVSGDEKYKLIASADIFVFPSYYPPEGHPWVIIEAMAAGLPVISTDQGAICESVLHGKNGFIVEKQQPDAIAEAIILLVNDENLRKRFSSMSRQLYEEKFTEQKIVGQMTDAFNSVIKGDV